MTSGGFVCEEEISGISAATNWTEWTSLVVSFIIVMLFAEPFMVLVEITLPSREKKAEIMEKVVTNQPWSVFVGHCNVSRGSNTNHRFRG
jgi:hypothetical protein